MIETLVKCKREQQIFVVCKVTSRNDPETMPLTCDYMLFDAFFSIIKNGKK